MRVDGSTVDLTMSSNGDLILISRDSNSLDLEDTAEAPLKQLEWLIQQRITNNEVDWGNDITDSQKSGLLTLSRDVGEIFYKPCASLDDFLGVQLNENTMSAIKTKIEEALFLDDSLRASKVNVKVVRLTESTVNVMVVCQVNRNWFEGRRFSKSPGALRAIRNNVLVITMNYNVGNGNLNISSIDLKEHY